MWRWPWISACDGRNRLGAVDVSEVGAIHGVLVHVEPAAPHRPLAEVERKPAGIFELGKLGNLVARLGAGGVVVHHQHPVALGHRPAAQLRQRRDALGVRDLGAAAIGAPLPVVKGAAEGVARHLAAMAQVSPEVRAVGVGDRGQA